MEGPDRQSGDPDGQKRNADSRGSDLQKLDSQEPQQDPKPQQPGLKRPDFQPIDDVESKVVKVDIQLPFVKVEEIGLNVAHLENLCQWAGIGSLTIKTHTGEGGSQRPIILGVHEDGTAVGGFEQAKSTTKSESSNSGPKWAFRIGKWADVVISLDLDYMQNLAVHSKDGARSAEEWAELLDKEIRKEVLSSGLDVLMTMDEPELIMTSLKQDIMVIVLNSALAINIYYGGFKILVPVALLASLVAWAYKRNKLKREINMDLGLSNNRRSLINCYGQERDRANVFLVLAHTRKLVAKIAPEIKMEEFEEGD